mgnify:FL=1
MASEITLAPGLAGRYAGALYELADEAKALDAVAGDLARLAAMVAESADLRRLIASPLIARDAQIKAISALAVQAGFTDLTRRFMGLAARNRRLFSLVAMVDDFQAILASRRGEERAEIVSAHALNSAQLEALTAALRGALGRKVTVERKVDPALLGGIKVRLGSRLLDASLATKLRRLELVMKGRA